VHWGGGCVRRRGKAGEFKFKSQSKTKTKSKELCAGDVCGDLVSGVKVVE
jgi:hypothetical protein